MASIPTHMLCGAAIGLWFARPPHVGRTMLVSACCAAIPDLDGIGYRLGVPYDSLLGHRGLSHSLLFAAVLATLAAVRPVRRWIGTLPAGSAWWMVALATASHGLLDAGTSGGLGVAFFAPMDPARHFLPWSPIRVSPMHLGAFFSARGLAILVSEARWVWLPSALLAGAALSVRRSAFRGARTAA